MGFKKGESGNPDGRGKGSSNKVTTEIKMMVTELVRRGLDVSLEKMQQIEDPVKYMDTVSKFIQYVLPKNIDHTSGGEKIEILSGLTTEELIKRAEALKKLEE